MVLLKADLLTLFTSCKHLEIYLQNLSIDILGVPSDTFDSCMDRIENSQNLMMVPRAVFESTQHRLLPRSRDLRAKLYTCIPRDLSTARSLAKLSGVYTIALRSDTVQMVDSTEINLLTQVRERKFIEVHIHSFLELLRSDKKVSTERMFYFLGESIEYALRRDVPVVVSSASPVPSQVLHPQQIDALLFSLGFTKRERRMMLEVYPLELLSIWREW